MIKLYPSTFMYLNIISLSMLMVLSSNNWLMVWMGMELSLFGFIPLFTSNTTTTEAIMKYYLMQASGSSMFLMSFLLSFKMSYLLSVLGMSMKLGLFPFFQWMPMVMMSLTWSGCIMMTTIQKIMPLMVVILLTNYYLLMIFSVTSIFISSIMGFNQTLMRPLMAYSSISHTSWIVMMTMLNNKMSLMYMILYFVTIAHLFNSFKKTNTEKINMNTTLNKESTSQSAILMILAGIPPFSIFFFKMYLFFVINSPLIIVTLMISTYLSTYYYLTFIIPNLLKMKNKNSTMVLTLLMLNMCPIILVF